ncbi:MAG: hypothetical protein LC777_11330 [Actinobacteria bacterium]|nr:hypothetical protein [Actinomycetota bacterium]
MTARIATAAVLGLTALAASASPAAAGPTPTPNGFCGAKNMVNENAFPHMVEAMTLHTNLNGKIGMGNAVLVSACPPTPQP